MERGTKRSALASLLELRGLAAFLNLSAILAILWSLMQVHFALFGMPHALIERPLHLVLAMAVAYLITPWKKGSRIGFIDYVLAFLCLAVGLYILANFERITTRVPYVDEVAPMDVVVAFAFLGLSIEVSRRTLGWGLTSVVLAFLAYGFLGPWMPGLLHHRGMSMATFAELQFLTTDGVMGVPLGVAAEIVFYFILFSALLEVSGGGQLFINLAMRATGSMRGGPAKAAVVSSGLMGTISGSATANVVGTGIFTIPLMKRLGFTPRFAGAVEAVASTGGQLMPPIMGAGAFIMADMTGIPYLRIAVAATLPAIIYYSSLFAMVDFQARRSNLRGLLKSQLPSAKRTLLERGLLIIGLVVLVYYIFAGFSLIWAAWWALVWTFFLGWAGWGLTKAISRWRGSSLPVADTNVGLYRMLQALENGAKKTVIVSIPCAMAGLIVGILADSNLGLKFTEIILSLSTGRLLLALLLVMGTCIIMGMGMPTSSAYIMAAVLLGPALVKLGLPTLAGHMFIYYFAILSMVTPPVALSAYVAAGIAESDMTRTGITAFRLSFAAFLVPFAFVFNPAMLWDGPLLETLWVTVTCLLGVVALAGATIGFMLVEVPFLLRAALFLSSILLIVPEKLTDLVGLALFLVLMGYQWAKQKRVGLSEQPGTWG